MAFDGLSEKLSAAFKKLRAKGKLTETDIKEAMREVRLALLEADVNYKVAKDFVASVSEKCMGAEVMKSLTPAQQVIKIVHEELKTLMGGSVSRIANPSKPPAVIMLCGLQGAGKTTHAAKLAYLLKSEGRRPLLAACDVYRPAAIEQLKVIGAKAGVPVFEMGQINPVEIARKALSHAKDHGNDVLLLDTAGRLHIDQEMMEELKKIKEELHPHEILLVIDAMIGQDAVNAAQSFDQAIGIDGVILTKLDSDTRGGAALSVRAVTGKPIKFTGTGEKISDLEPFYPDRMASRILGMGDVLTLIEKAQKQFDENEALELTQKFNKNKLDFNMMLESMKQMKKMGSIKNMLSMLPGVGQQIKDEDIDESQLGKVEAIILSMTPRERANPSLINPSRKRRIAAGSGTRVEDVNRLIKQLEQSQKMMKQFSGKMGRRRMPMMPF